MADEEYRAVLVKIYHMMSDPSTDSTISWGPNGKSFIVWNPRELSRVFLPKILDSFTDMISEDYDSFAFFTDMLLHGYGFEKVNDYYDQQWEFSEERFLRDKPELTLNMYTPVDAKTLDMKVANFMKVWSKIMKSKRISFKYSVYKLVDDPALDSIISWSESGESFIVWDPAEFSRVVLPKIFFHRDFSLFTRTLIDYGFRNVDSERWEFAYEDFVRGNNIYNRPDFPPQVSKVSMRKKNHEEEEKDE